MGAPVGARCACDRSRLSRFDGSGCVRSEVETEIRITLAAPRQFDCLLAPTRDLAPELLMAGIVEIELVASKSAKPDEHLGEHRRREPAVFLGCKPTQPVEAVARLHR